MRLLRRSHCQEVLDADNSLRGNGVPHQVRFDLPSQQLASDEELEMQLLSCLLVELICEHVSDELKHSRNNTC